MLSAERSTTDRQFCPDLAAVHELYGLLIACDRNSGKRTAHRFECSNERFLILLKLAEREGFGIQVDNMTLIVNRPGVR